MLGDAGSVTMLLRKAQAGDCDATERLAELVYAELRKIAAIRMRAERPGHTLTPTALANEAWLRLREYGDVTDRNHFFAVAATAMRRLLIEHARARHAAKRGKGVAVPIDEINLAAPQADKQIIALNDALDRLSEVNPRAAKVVEFRYFAGLKHHEIGALLELDRRTVDRDWTFAKAWLFNEVGARPSGGRVSGNDAASSPQR
jgi:RNA polymerase sigma-70 factor, ECF subfamily